MHVYVGLVTFFGAHSCISQGRLTILTPISSVLNSKVSCLHTHNILPPRRAWFSYGHVSTRIFPSYDAATLNIWLIRFLEVWKSIVEMLGIISTHIPLIRIQSHGNRRGGQWDLVRWLSVGIGSVFYKCPPPLMPVFRELCSNKLDSSSQSVLSSLFPSEPDEYIQWAR